MDCMCFVMINLATGQSKVIELPNCDGTWVCDEEYIIEVIIDKSNMAASRLFNKTWLSCYHRAKNIVYNNITELKVCFTSLYDTYGLKYKPSLVKIHKQMLFFEYTHGDSADMLYIPGLDKSDTMPDIMIEVFLRYQYCLGTL